MDAATLTAHRAGLSEFRLRALRSTIRDLETADPARFDDPAVRRTVRYLSALVPDSVPDDRLHDAIADIIGNPHLSPEQVREILSGGHDVSTLRTIGRMLREGKSRRDIATTLGIGRRVVTELASFLGVIEARMRYLRDQAMDALRDGTQAREFAERHGLGEQPARELLLSAA